MSKKTTNKSKRSAKKQVKLFKDLEDDNDVERSQCQFLNDVWPIGCHNVGPIYTFVAFRKFSNGKWIEVAIDHSDGLSIASLVDVLKRYNRWDYDQYFCPNAFSRPRRKRECAIPTRFGWCDVDESDPEKYDPPPSLIWRTSPNRFQALWVWDSHQSPEDAESFSRALAYRHGGDRNGWSVTKLLRLPGSINHKREYQQPFVQVLKYDWTRIRSRPDRLVDDRAPFVISTTLLDVDPTKFEWRAVFKRYRRFLSSDVQRLIGHRRAYDRDRSARVYCLIAGLFEAGASPNEIASVVWSSPYFREKHGDSRNALRTEVSRIIAKLEAG